MKNESDSKRIFSEVDVMVENLSFNLKAKLPQTIINHIKSNKDVKYKPMYDKNRELEDQGYSTEAYSYLISIYLKYLANDEEKRNMVKILMTNKGEKK